MKITPDGIPIGGVTLKEDIKPQTLELETEIIRFEQPLHVQAEVSRITNAVTVELKVEGSMKLVCGRCLTEFEVKLNKEFRLNYEADTTVKTIDLDPDIREEIILSYPIKPLCNQVCKGLCPRCGKNLNEGSCSCAVT